MLNDSELTRGRMAFVLMTGAAINVALLAVGVKTFDRLSERFYG